MAQTQSVGTTRSDGEREEASGSSDATRPATTQSSEPVLSLSDVRKDFGSETAVDGVSLDVRPGELLTFLGPSGCGKTTTLRTIAGLEEPTDGRVVLADETVAGDGALVPPEER
ncbi:ATP-binding cassette domain-containing protein, partial [Halorubrum pallidum]